MSRRSGSKSKSTMRSTRVHAQWMEWAYGTRTEREPAWRPVLDLLRENRGVVFSPTGVAMLVGVPLSVAHSALYRLHQAGKVQRDGQGYVIADERRAA